MGKPVVLDSSVAIAWVIGNEPWTARALDLAADIGLGALEPIVAPNLRFEVRGALVRAARRSRIAWQDILPRLASLERMSFAGPGIDLPERDLLRLCRDHNLGWGDAHHALVAERLSLPLITADDRLVRALAGSAIWVESIGSRPAPECSPSPARLSPSSAPSPSSTPPPGRSPGDQPERH